MAIDRSKEQRRTSRRKRASGRVTGYNIYDYPGPLLASIETRGGKQIVRHPKGGDQQNLLGKVKLVDGRLVVTGPHADELKELLHDLRSHARVKDDEALFKVIPDYFRGGLIANPVMDDEESHSNDGTPEAFA